jgi:2-polyprenyl-3-methyl-5-hydroxy-6-metoxy-1,4-benzoquinol methylase
VTLDAVNKLTSGLERKTISIADLGCGSGDMLRLLSNWAAEKKINVELTGIDANPHIIDFARRRCADHPEIKFQVIDIFSPEFKKKKFDVVLGTLFYHHFESQQLATFFSELKSQAQIGIVINDIHRHWLAYYSIKLLTRIFSHSAMVKFDAPLSVLRAFKKKDLRDIMTQAGMQKHTMKWKWAFRWQVIWRNSNHQFLA